MAETRTTCCYCGVGCGVIVEHDGARITGVRGDPAHPANLGRLCSKGATLHLTAAGHLAGQTRLLRPMRRAHRGEAPVAIGWDDALTEAADRLAMIHAAHGPDAIGVYISGQLLTEDYYVFNKLVKGLLGSNQIDSNSRLCMSSAVAGYKATLGADAPPCAYEDLALAQTVFIAGSNLAWAHPILMRRLEDARRANPGQKWIVADPRRTETAAAADLHLPLLPGSDVALCHGLLHLLLWEGLADTAFIAAHTRGFEALRQRVREHTPRQTARLTGLAEDDIVTAARWFGGHTPTLSLYCQGLNQSASGTAGNAALINLHLASGQIGRPGAGPFSLTGQPNAMGGREVGGMATLLSAHRDLADPAHRAEVARLWGVPDVPARPGRAAVEMFQAAADGQVKALWIVCTNPAQSLPDQATVRRALQRVEFVLLQEAFAHTATARHADLLLPAATWGEKDGTVTNSERRISRVRAAVPPAGEARPDWAIAAELARRIAARVAPDRAGAFAYDSPQAVWNEHRESTRGRDLDITGLSYALLERDGPQQWPFPAGATRGRTRLYEDGVFPTADGRAVFADVAPAALAEPRDARHPFQLNTGRLRDQWHGMSRTGLLGRLYGHDGLPCVELHGQDMDRLHLAEGELVRVRSRRGELVLAARRSDTVAPAQAFIAMHWGDEALLGTDTRGTPTAGVNGLTTPERCPQSRQPALKHAAVAIEKVELPWRLVALAWLPAQRAHALRAAAHAGLGGFAHASLLPFGREGADDGDAPTGGSGHGHADDPGAADGRHARPGRVGLVLRAAAAAAPADAVLAPLRAAFGVEGPGVLAYQDARRGRQRALRVWRDAAGAERLQAVWLAGDIRGEDELARMLQAARPLPGPARDWLAPGPRPGRPAEPRGRQVCTCFDVDEAAIRGELAGCAEAGADARLARLQARLRCGTNCGSCLPALRRLAQAAATVGTGTGTSAGAGAGTGTSTGSGTTMRA